MAAGPVGGSGSTQTAWVLNLLTDLAFNLLIFFVVCAATGSDKGRPQPFASPKDDKKNLPDPKHAQTHEVYIDRTSVKLDGTEIPETELKTKLASFLTGKTADQDRLVEFESSPDTPYERWVKFATVIEKANGIIILRLSRSKGDSGK